MNETYEEAKVAYHMALISGHSEELQEFACKNPEFAYRYAKNVKDADIMHCQNNACLSPVCAYWFAKDIKEANIELCQISACKVPHIAYWFALDIKNSDLCMSMEAVRGTRWEWNMGRLLMDSIIG